MPQIKPRFLHYDLQYWFCIDSVYSFGAGGFQPSSNWTAPSRHGTQPGFRDVNVSLPGVKSANALLSMTPALTTTTPAKTGDSVHMVELHLLQKRRDAGLPLPPMAVYVVGSPATSVKLGRGTTQLVLYVDDVVLWQLRQ